MTKENQSSGPPNPPNCRHGKAFNPIRSNCQECVDEDKEIKLLVHPLIDQYWAGLGKDDLYHIVFRTYHMGMRNEHLSEMENPPLDIGTITGTDLDKYGMRLEVFRFDEEPDIDYRKRIKKAELKRQN